MKVEWFDDCSGAGEGPYTLGFAAYRVAQKPELYNWVENTDAKPFKDQGDKRLPKWWTPSPNYNEINR